MFNFSMKKIINENTNFHLLSNCNLVWYKLLKIKPVDVKEVKSVIFKAHTLE